ncbi:MAG TPA: O-succinylbenzoate synthase, partial [Nocardioides sp.]|nr:O-succinylbenzoate synthase [Nocardioides sp.]
MRVWSVPMRTRFRGITVREGVLLRGVAGWGEWSPFLEYDAAVAEPWLRCAEEAAAGDWPAAVRDRVPVNVTVPAVGPEQAHAVVRAGGCRTAKVKVAEPGQTLADDQARLEA